MRSTRIKRIRSNTLPLQNAMPCKFRSKVGAGRNLTIRSSTGSFIRPILLNSDISTSLYASSDVKPAPQFTDVLQIEDNTGYSGNAETKTDASSCGRLTQLMCLANLTKAKTSSGVEAVVSSEPFWRIWGLLGGTRLGASSRSSFASVYAVHHWSSLILYVLSCLQFNIPPPASLSSISLQQITACLQPPGCSPQLFWLQLQIYLYCTMQRAGISDGGLRVQSVYIPQSDCLSSTLVRFNRCQTESGRASVSLFH